MSNEASGTGLFGSGTDLANAGSPWNAAIVALRVALGWVFLYSGITKVLDPGWTASGYLQNAIPTGNPFGGLWPILASTPLIDVLVQWGLTLTGIGLVLGAFVRWNAFWASFMMCIFWASSLPLEHSFLIDEHVVYVLVLFSLALVGAGRVAGVDGYLLGSAIVRRNGWLRYVLS